MPDFCDQTDNELIDALLKLDFERTLVERVGDSLDPDQLDDAALLARIFSELHNRRGYSGREKELLERADAFDQNYAPEWETDNNDEF